MSGAESIATRKSGGGSEENVFAIGTAWQVYVRPFLSEGGRWLISPGAGGTPLWTSDTEVVYVD